MVEKLSEKRISEPPLVQGSFWQNGVVRNQVLLYHRKNKAMKRILWRSLPSSYRALSGDETGADEETLQARRARPGVGVRRTLSSPGGRDNLGPLEAASLLALAQRLRGATETT